MIWSIRRTERNGETVALDIEENGELVAGVTIRGDIAKAEKRAALIRAAPAMMATLQILADGHYCEGEEREMAQAALKEARGESESEYTLNGEPIELDVFLGPQNMFTVKELLSIRDMKRGESLMFGGKLLRRII